VLRVLTTLDGNGGHMKRQLTRRSFRGVPLWAFATLMLLFPATASTSSDRSARYPNAFVVVGDAGATGLGSDPAHPSRDQLQNSWATGTNPAVQSVYMRLLAVYAAVRGHGTNLARDELTTAQFEAQVRKAASLRPTPELVIVQISDRDLATCDGNDAANYAAVRSDWSSALGSLTKALPNARILLVSTWGGSYGTPWGSIDAYVKYLDGLDTNTRLTHAGKHLCQLVESPSGRVVPERVAYVKKTWAGYEAQKAAACAAVPQCLYDHGAAMRLAVTGDDIAHGGSYMTVAGNAQFAAAEWKALAGLIDQFPPG
jgi:hypothetical protein